jgi:two-component system, OmpR family, sensor kinase
MLAIGSSKTERLLILGWAATAVVNIILMYVLPGRETIPFHLVWIGLSIIYGYTTWRPMWMVVVLGLVAVTTGYVLIHHAQINEIGWEEVSEVPLMSAVFVVMVLHVRQRQQALAEVGRLADTERRRAEVQQLFVRLASHELRTPITVARGHTELLHDATKNRAVRRDAVVVLEELDKLARITQRLVTLMQIEARYVRRIMDIDAELPRIVRRWEPTAERVWSVESDVGEEWVNQERLEAALDCLLENAVKFTDCGGHIAVRGWSENDSWFVEVADSGQGMTAERAAELTNARGPMSWSTSGTGLGLAIVRAVVESWGGSVQINGVPNHGATVTLQIGHRAPAEPSGASRAIRERLAVTA